MTFEELNVSPPILRALKTEGYSVPTPIQEEAIPLVLSGKDMLGSAQTGTGKTAAFAVPILQLLDATHGESHKIKALILAPTRELVIQIKDSFVAYGRFLRVRSTAIYGGVSQKPQEAALRVGVDVVVATPGRLLDLMNQGLIKFLDLKFLVLDEADHMLDMGFIHDVKRIVAALPEHRQTLLFSATMPDEIVSLASAILRHPVRIAVSPPTSTVEATDQTLYLVDKKNKRNLLIHLLMTEGSAQALVFSRTKHGANKVAEELIRAGINTEAIHGNKSQAARQLALNNFKTRKTRVLIATDIAARGIDVVDLPLVINFDLPEVPETYIHRIGRTGRAGLSGRAVSFCDCEEMSCLSDIERLLGNKLPLAVGNPYPMTGDPVFQPVHRSGPGGPPRGSRNNFYKGGARGRRPR